ncbi:virulence protein [Salmonella enterica subsp. enterica serovar Thompson]|nr:hypothetical protein MFDS1004024_02673 [Salmonella enterica]SQH06289.1 virulence protein [Salmonella enterica subsp. enterica serovar Thompson]SQJ24546.1 virulence protein [Salmonella enterica subsp. enterica serovar Thompson]VEC86745.1 virulence protein [Salmonella enterica subsp. enterica]
MLPVTYRLIPQSGVSTYGLNTADTPVFPDIPEHAPNPSRLRLAHDSLAINSEFRLEPECVVEYLISGAGGIDPDTEIDDDTYDECYDELSSVLQNAYTQSETFRRLMNYAYEKNYMMWSSAGYWGQAKPLKLPWLRNTSNFQKAGKLFVSIWTILMIHIPNIMKVTKEDNFLTQNVHLFMKLYMH